MKSWDAVSLRTASSRFDGSGRLAGDPPPNHPQAGSFINKALLLQEQI